MALSQQQIDALNGVSSAVQPNQAMGALSKSTQAVSGMINTAGNFAQGVAKSEIGTVQGASEIGEDIATAATKPLLGDAANAPQATQQFNQAADQFTQPQGGAETAGYWTGQLAQFLAPTDAIKGMEAGVDASKIPTLAKVGVKAATEAGVGGGISAAQSPDNKVQAGETGAATFGLLKGASGLAGSAVKAMGLPEHLYSTVFKTASGDMLNELKSGGISQLQKANPALFKQFADEGIIKTAADGSFSVDETLAKQALDRGLKGSVKSMAGAIVKGTLESESKAQAIAKSAPPIAVAGADKLTNVLTTVKDAYENVGQGEISKRAGQFIDALKSNGGEIDASTGLKLRRFLDGMRTKASYNPQATLSTSAENFKYWSDSLRGQINKIPGMKPVMNDYQFNIEAMNALAKTAARRGNNAVLNIMDTLIFEGGIQEGSPGLGAAMGAARRIATSPIGATNLGSAIEKSGTLTKKGAFLKGATTQGVNAIEGGNNQDNSQ